MKQSKARVHHIGIVGRGTAALYFGQRGLHSQGGAVGSVRGQRLGHVSYGHDARLKQNLLPFESLWIAGASRGKQEGIGPSTARALEHVRHVIGLGRCCL